MIGQHAVKEEHKMEIDNVDAQAFDQEVPDKSAKDIKEDVIASHPQVDIENAN